MVWNKGDTARSILGVVRFSTRIFNRWGRPVWETTRVDGRGWEGKFSGEAQPTGVYIYLAEAEFKNGYREKSHGNLTLLLQQRRCFDGQRYPKSKR